MQNDIKAAHFRSGPWEPPVDQRVHTEQARIRQNSLEWTISWRGVNKIRIPNHRCGWNIRIRWFGCKTTFKAAQYAWISFTHVWQAGCIVFLIVNRFISSDRVPWTSDIRDHTEPGQLVTYVRMSLITDGNYVYLLDKRTGKSSLISESSLYPESTLYFCMMWGVIIIIWCVSSIAIRGMSWLWSDGAIAHRCPPRIRACDRSNLQQKTWSYFSRRTR